MTKPVRVIGIIASLLILAACAATTPNTKPQTAASVAQNPTCVKQTGSRIPADDASCRPGRAYSSDDINRTGATSAGDALRLLDPSITVSH
jgi:uncharacterized lipoprotein YajG